MRSSLKMNKYDSVTFSFLSDDYEDCFFNVDIEFKRENELYTFSENEEKKGNPLKCPGMSSTYSEVDKNGAEVKEGLYINYVGVMLIDVFTKLESKILNRIGNDPVISPTEKKEYFKALAKECKKLFIKRGAFAFTDFSYCCDTCIKFIESNNIKLSEHIRLLNNKKAPLSLEVLNTAKIVNSKKTNRKSLAFVDRLNSSGVLDVSPSIILEDISLKHNGPIFGHQMTSEEKHWLFQIVQLAKEQGTPKTCTIQPKDFINRLGYSAMDKNTKRTTRARIRKGLKYLATKYFMIQAERKNEKIFRGFTLFKFTFTESDNDKTTLSEKWEFELDDSIIKTEKSYWPVSVRALSFITENTRFGNKRDVLLDAVFLILAETHDNKKTFSIGLPKLDLTKYIFKNPGELEKYLNIFIKAIKISGKGPAEILNNEILIESTIKDGVKVRINNIS
jgi:hypothetical protein